MSGTGMFIVACYSAIGLAAVGTLHYFLGKRRRSRWFATLPLLVGVIALAVAPFVEEAWIESRFNELCQEAGIHVVRKVEAPGFYDTTMRSGYEYINRLGYAFMEHPADDRKKIEHLEKVGGDWKRTILDRPTARYHLVESRAHKPVGHKLSVQERVVIDTQATEVIARNTTYMRFANTVDQAWMGMIGSTLRSCPDPFKGPARASLIDQTIVPLKP